jgi:hypothetical protein
MRRLMGNENEYAFNAAGPRGGVADRTRALHELNAIAAREYACLPSLGGSGIFMANGGRSYVDAGEHQEMCTPEVDNPWDVVRYLLAGEMILFDLAKKLVDRRKVGSAKFYKVNVDYSGMGTTWGAHENYMHRADASKLPKDMIPFLISRVIITGAGGFDPTSAGSCRFTLSPRSFHINASVSSCSTGGRGIYHTKSESLCNGGYQRLHVLVGESNCSQRVNWLKAATTSMAVAMAEAGLNPGGAVALRSPVDAYRIFASDPTCKETAATAGGGRVSALQIQRHYCEMARRVAGEPYMPAWAPVAVAEWEAMLTRLESAPQSVATCLDWAIKHSIFESRIQRRGFSWWLVKQWNNLMGLLRVCGDLTAQTETKPQLNAKFVLDPQGPLKNVVQEMTPILAQRGMSWEQMEGFLKLRLELFELDMRFGELGPGGIFNGLDAAGVLNHRVAGVDEIERAMTEPPATGRAKVRGEAIRRLHGENRRYGCDWAYIVDTQTRAALDMRNPFTDSEKWVAHLSAPAEFAALGLGWINDLRTHIAERCST